MCSLLTAIHIDDPSLCPRTRTVHKLAENVDEAVVVLARGTPASGKTTLACLLCSYYRQRNVPSVVISEWQSNTSGSYMDFLVRCANEAGYNSVTTSNLVDYDIVFILDETHVKLEDSYWWFYLMKLEIERTPAPRFCIFSSYGSPNARAPDNFSRGTHLGYIEDRKQVTISRSLESKYFPFISLFYKRYEFDDVVLRSCTDVRHPLPLHKGSSDYIYTLTIGHPGAVMAILDMLRKVSCTVDFCLHSLIAYGMRCRCTVLRLSMGTLQL